MTGFGLTARWKRGWRKLAHIPCPECGQSLPLTREIRDRHLLEVHGWKRPAESVDTADSSRQMESAS